MPATKVDKDGMEVIMEVSTLPKEAMIMTPISFPEPTSDTFKQIVEQKRDISSIVMDEYQFAPSRPIELVYICMKYTEPSLAQTWLNVNRALLTACEVILLGVTPYVPHLSFFLDGMCRRKRMNVPYETWMNYCMTILRRCDCLLSTGDPTNSKGMQMEIALCEQLHIPIFYSLAVLSTAISKEHQV